MLQFDKFLFFMIFLSSHTLHATETMTYCWIHQDEGVYNTYIIDNYHQDWALIMHCAEKKRSSRYLSALMLSRTPTLGHNVKVFLREKLPQYNIDLDYMFDVYHDDCKEGIGWSRLLF